MMWSFPFPSRVVARCWDSGSSRFSIGGGAFGVDLRKSRHVRIARMKRLLPFLGLVCITVCGSAQEIAKYMPKEPFSTAGESSKQRQDRIAAAQAEAMAAIEALGLYAVVSKPASSMLNGVPINITAGNGFPFVGFDGGMARLKLGAKWMQVPRNSVTLVKLADQPVLAKNYQLALAAYEAALSRGK